MLIRKVKEHEYEIIKSFYDDIIEDLKDAKYSPGWKKDIYPSSDDLKQAIEHETLYVGIENHQIVASMVFNHDYNEGYRHVKWSIDVSDEQLYVVHILAVHPDYMNQGYARKMLEYVIDHAKKNHMRTIRLDILQGHIPAKKSYTKIGFKYVDTIAMYYEDTGLTYYECYEYIIGSHCD